VTKTPIEDLEDLIAWNWPDHLWSQWDLHSAQVYTIWILDLDQRYTQWRASLSLDHRWTLSPVSGPWENDAPIPRGKDPT